MLAGFSSVAAGAVAGVVAGASVAGGAPGAIVRSRLVDTSVRGPRDGRSLSTRLDEFKGKKQIVVFCRSGSRSAQAYQILQDAGFTNVVNGGTWSDVQAQLPPH